MAVSVLWSILEIGLVQLLAVLSMTYAVLSHTTGYRHHYIGICGSDSSSHLILYMCPLDLILSHIQYNHRTDSLV